MRPILFTFHLGGRLVGIHTYGILIAIGFAAGIGVAWREGQRQGLDGGRILDLSFWILIAGLLGSRALYALVNAGSFGRACIDGNGAPRTLASVVWDCTRVLHVWEGGLVFYGGFLAATGLVLLFARREGWNFWTVGDVFAPGLALGHAFGRLGCFAAGCCFGKTCAAAASALCVLFPNDSVAYDQLQALGAVAAGSSTTPPLHPTQLFEAAGDLIIFLILLGLRRRQHRHANHRPGLLVLTYAGLYAILRFVVELYRGDIERSFVAALSTPRLSVALHLPPTEPALLSSGQLLSVVVLVGVSLLIYRRARANN
ncbi:MAG TPA: prolipoprotein diacylglyceryl transferase [Polyangia bacterium]